MMNLDRVTGVTELDSSRRQAVVTTHPDDRRVATLPRRSSAQKVKKVVLVITDGVGIRNFLLSPFVEECSADITVLHRCPDEFIPNTRSAGSIEWQKMPEMPDAAVTFTLRQTLSQAHVYWGDTHSMRYTRSRKPGGSWRTRAASYTARFAGKMLASRTGIRLLESAYFRSVQRTQEVSRLQRIFAEMEPDIVLSANHRLPGAAVPVLAARSLGIPTATFIASWDNLTSKGRIAAPFDQYLVWSEHMKRDLLRFYPHLSTDCVHVVGTPQFDSYGQPDRLWGRDEFFRRIGADPERPLICYSGGDEGTCPEDHNHIRILLELIRSASIKFRPQVLLRPCPVDRGRRYDQVRRDFPELLYAQPAWGHPSGGDWSSSVPLEDDVQFLANLTAYSDLNVNIASTMTLDFGIHDKPVVNIAYDLSAPPPLRLPLWNLFYSWEHYEPVVKFGAARFAHSPEQLALHINHYLEHPSADREGRRKLCDLQVGVPLGQSSRTIVEVLERIVR